MEKQEIEFKHYLQLGNRVFLIKKPFKAEVGQCSRLLRNPIYRISCKELDISVCGVGYHRTLASFKYQLINAIDFNLLEEKRNRAFEKHFFLENDDPISDYQISDYEKMGESPD